MYAPLKRISKQKLKFRNKPWITLGLQKSVSIKNRLLTKCAKLKNVTLKTAPQTSYFTNYSQNNLNELKSTWKGTKKLIFLIL